ncbi:MAG TPA: hypothetical protein PK119_00570 [Candidatus Paceibacterota bacterium]|nr:hypothetical protein [Candidatus Paceibacterota bacterium]
MSETSSHKRVKGHAAGKSGETEKKIKYGGRIDVFILFHADSNVIQGTEPCTT